MDTRNKLIQEIESAFADIILESGIGIFEAEAIDNYATEAEVRRERGKDRDSWSRWQDIPDHVIEKYYSVLCFTDPLGTRFLLPAYMRFTLKNYDTSNSITIDSTIYALDRGMESFGGDPDFLNGKQKSVIARFLKYIALEVGEKFADAEVASRAYENHWGIFDV